MLRNATKWFVYATIAYCCLSLGHCRIFAQDPENEELEERIQILSKEAAELRELGRNEQAAQRLRAATELRERLANRQRASSDGPRAKYLKQIFAAVDALRELGRPEDARRLSEIAERLRHQDGRPSQRERGEQIVRERVVIRRERDEREGHGERREREEREEVEIRRDRDEGREREERIEVEIRRDRERPEQARDRERPREARREQSERRGREREEHPEVRAARQQLEVLRTAMSALAEAGRGDGANRLEQAIHALELGIEGRRDEHARQVRQSAPNRNNQAELLMLAHRILRERGNEDAARAVGQLAERFAAGARRGRENERNQELRQVQNRIRELTAQLEELHRHVQNLQRD